MALLFSEGWDGYSSSADFVDRGWTLTNSGFIALNATGGPWGEPCLEITSRSTGGLPKLVKNLHVTSSNTTLRMAIWLKTDAGFTANSHVGASSQLFGIEDGTPANWVDVNLNEEGFLMLSRTETARSASKNYVANSLRKVNDGNWHHIEIALEISTTVGTSSLWVDGELQHSQTGIDTSDGATSLSTYTRFYLAANRLNDTAQKVYFSDPIVWDDAGSDFTGALPNHIHRIATLFPDGAGNYTQFTPSAGSNFQNVDDAASDDDTTYNVSGTAGHIDTFTYGAMPWTPDAVFAVVLSTIVRSETNTPNYRAKARISSTDYDGASVATSTTYTVKEQVWEDSPSTGNDWTEAEINGAEFGYENVSGVDNIRVTRQILEVIADEASTDELRVTSVFVEVVLEEGVAPAVTANVITCTVACS